MCSNVMPADPAEIARRMVAVFLGVDLMGTVVELEAIRAGLHEFAGQARSHALAAAADGEAREAQRWRAVLVECDLAARALLSPTARCRGAVDLAFGQEGAGDEC